ncbi:hypothetical protein ARTHRO9V_90162 [Arthrobacter sp. 9V]|nr:hypothetical protein ARTHRO9V_90162 [Arthrobacter sp. 9V]
MVLASLGDRVGHSVINLEGSLGAGFPNDLWLLPLWWRRTKGSRLARVALLGREPNCRHL